MSDVSDKIAKLQTRAEALQAQLRATQTRISALQKQQAAAQQAEMLEILKSSNLTPDQLRALLEKHKPAKAIAPASTAGAE